MLSALLACGSHQQVGGTEQLALEIDPREIDFGVVALGQSTEQVLTLRNDATSDVLVTELRTSSTDLALIGFETRRVPAGGEEELTVQWTPSSGQVLDGSLRLRVGTVGSPGALTDLKVPLLGTVSGAQLTLSEQGADLGIVSVGCTATLSIDVQNTGGDELVIHSLELTNDLEFTVEDGTGAKPVLPVKIPPGFSAVIDVVYTPTSEHQTSTTLHIESNDALAPTQSVSVDGEGLIEGSNTMSWTVERREVVTGIIQINDQMFYHHIDSAFADRVHAFLPALFEGLLDAGVSYRLAIVVHQNGEVVGDVPYIDDSFTVDEADAAAQAMLDTMSAHGDNDQGLETCLNAIEQNESWLLDESDPWPESKLNLLVINSDSEQSPSDFTQYVKLYSKYKDPADFAVHGIAGDYPGGCVDTLGTGAYGNASYNLKSAVDATGGMFLSICAADWTKSVAALVDSWVDVETFVLEQEPAPESIEVRVDGVQLFSGWWYDEKARAIAFDDATFPPRGSELRVDYLLAVSCK